MCVQRKDITLTYLCPASYDRNKACDDTVYNSDLDAAYLIIKGRDLLICQNEDLKLEGKQSMKSSSLDGVAT